MAFYILLLFYNLFFLFCFYFFSIFTIFCLYFSIFDQIFGGSPGYAILLLCTYNIYLGNSFFQKYFEVNTDNVYNFCDDSPTSIVKGKIVFADRDENCTIVQQTVAAEVLLLIKLSKLIT